MEDSPDIHFHGTKSTNVFEEFKTPTGESVMDVEKGGVVYTTKDLRKAIKHAKSNGQIVVCTIDPRNAIPYAEQREIQGLPPKKGSLTRDVYVTLPKDVTPEIFFSLDTFRAIMDSL